MGSMFGMYTCKRYYDNRKPWRYPGIPIPHRLRDRYK